LEHWDTFGHRPSSGFAAIGDNRDLWPLQGSK
jgi:hypothetical protein